MPTIPWGSVGLDDMISTCDQVWLRPTNQSVTTDTMNQAIEFNPGDEVVHPRRLEWGSGVVDQATKILHEGRSAQRLVVSFKHRGKVTMNTGVVPLAARDGQTVVNHVEAKDNHVEAKDATKTDQGWLASLDQAAQSHELRALPESLTDPFASLQRRLTNTLDNYRYRNTPRLLLDWAIVQTGLDDPMTKYTRQELEQAFDCYSRDRDNHLIELVHLIKRQNEGAFLDETLATATDPTARSALANAMKK